MAIEVKKNKKKLSVDDELLESVENNKSSKTKKLKKEEKTVLKKKRKNVTVAEASPNKVKKLFTDKGCDNLAEDNKDNVSQKENAQEETPEVPVKRKKKRKKKLPPLPAPDPGAFESMLLKEAVQLKHDMPLSTNADSTEIQQEVTNKDKKKAKKMKRVKPVAIEDIVENKKDKNSKSVEGVVTSEDKTSAQELAIQYLTKWQTNRENWAFKKVRQVWLLQNMFDENLVPDDTFKTLLYYLQNLKGTARTKTVSDAENFFVSCETNSDLSHHQTIKLGRCKELIQLLS